MHKSQQEQCRSLLRLRWWTPAEHTCPPGLMGGAGRLAGRPAADLKLCPQRHAPSTQAPCADGSPWARVRWQWCVGTLFLMSVGVGSIFFFCGREVCSFRNILKTWQFQERKVTDPNSTTQRQPLLTVQFFFLASSLCAFPFSFCYTIFICCYITENWTYSFF